MNDSAISVKLVSKIDQLGEEAKNLRKEGEKLRNKLLGAKTSDLADSFDQMIRSILSNYKCPNCSNSGHIKKHCPVEKDKIAFFKVIQNFIFLFFIICFFSNIFFGFK